MDVDLVTDDYYARELAYEDKIIQKANFEKLNVDIEIEQNEIGIMIDFPSEIANPSGEIYFYHPSKQLFDRRFPIDVDSLGIQYIDRNEIVAGKYHIHLTWEENDKAYFFQKILLIR